MIVVRRIYTPKPGGGLQNHLKDVQKATVDAGFPPIVMYRQVLGPHGTLVTVQRWASVREYEDSRKKVRQTRSITEIFERIYPTLASTHVTEIWEALD